MASKSPWGACLKEMLSHTAIWAFGQASLNTCFFATPSGPELPPITPSH